MTIVGVGSRGGVIALPPTKTSVAASVTILGDTHHTITPAETIKIKKGATAGCLAEVAILGQEALTTMPLGNARAIKEDTTESRVVEIGRTTRIITNPRPVAAILEVKPLAQLVGTMEAEEITGGTKDINPDRGRIVTVLLVGSTKVVVIIITLQVLDLATKTSERADGPSEMS